MGLTWLGAVANEIKLNPVFHPLGIYRIIQNSQQEKANRERAKPPQWDAGELTGTPRGTVTWQR